MERNACSSKGSGQLWDQSRYQAVYNVLLDYGVLVSRGLFDLVPDLGAQSLEISLFLHHRKSTVILLQLGLESDPIM